MKTTKEMHVHADGPIQDVYNRPAENDP